jgi:outer membrane receptor for Fe3+-dicitrate
VGGVVNFVTRAIPRILASGGVEGQLSPTSSQNNPKETHNLMMGGTADNGFGPPCSTPAPAAATGANTAPRASMT